MQTIRRGTATLETMTREYALTVLDRHVRIVHSGPGYVQPTDPEGVVVEVTDTQLFIRDPAHPDKEPRGWHLAPISDIILMDVPVD